MSLANIETEYKLIRSWNLTYHQKANIFYPSNIKQLKNIIISLRKKIKLLPSERGSVLMIVNQFHLMKIV